MPLVSLNVAPDYSTPSEMSNCPCLYLNEAQCKALGISGAIDAGTVIGMNIQVTVVRSTTSIDNADDDNDPDICLGLEVTDAEIVAPASSSAKGAAGKLYGKS